MTVFIALDAAQAEKLRGMTSPGHALNPVMLADGVTYILPMEVLDDPEHADVLSAFALGKIDALDAKVAPRKDDVDKVAEAAFAVIDVTAKEMQRDVLEDELVKWKG